MILRAILIAFLAASPWVARAQDAGNSLDRIVPVERQRQLGLDRLSAEQRAGVARLLQDAYQLGQQNSQRAAAPAPSRSQARPTAEVVETQIDGDFEGWEGETIVKLMNGQIWQQSEYHYTYSYSFMPKVMIFNSGGGYKMKVDGIDRAVGVTRLR